MDPRLAYIWLLLSISDLARRLAMWADGGRGDFSVSAIESSKPESKDQSTLERYGLRICLAIAVVAFLAGAGSRTETAATVLGATVVALYTIVLSRLQERQVAELSHSVRAAQNAADAAILSAETQRFAFLLATRSQPRVRWAKVGAPRKRGGAANLVRLEIGNDGDSAACALYIRGELSVLDRVVVGDVPRFALRYAPAGAGDIEQPRRLEAGGTLWYRFIAEGWTPRFGQHIGIQFIVHYREEISVDETMVIEFRGDGWIDEGMRVRLNDVRVVGRGPHPPAADAPADA